MLDRLPTEFFLRVLEIAAPALVTPPFFAERRQLLLACSLLSKGMCSVAQPLLPEVYSIDRVGDWDALRVVEKGSSRGSKLAAFANSQPVFASLVELSLHNICVDPTDFPHDFPSLTSTPALKALGIINPRTRVDYSLAQLRISPPSLDILELATETGFDDPPVHYPHVSSSLLVFKESLDPRSVTGEPLP